MRNDRRYLAFLSAVLAALVFGVPMTTGLLSAGAGGPPAAWASERRPDMATFTTPPDGWKTIGAPATVAGEALFRVINGGAEIYLQTGFRQARFASLQSPEGLDINLEIYEMTDPAAARSIFAQKSGDAGVKAPYGQEARLETYYLNFWRGRYQVTLSGYKATPETIAAIRTLAATVDKRLQGD